MKHVLSIAVFLLFSLSVPSLFAQLVAFPGAEGFGRYATGGRTGTVYHVTNLNDSGAGSLRDAVSQSNRIVVFDVAGVIKVSSRIVFSSNLYVAGQTAPGEGITVYGDGVSFTGANNTIVRYIRFRMGNGGTSGCDAAGAAHGTNMIFDHLSVSWGLDETFSISPDDKGTLGNITIQNSIIGQGLLPHSAGGLIQADSITLYRNLYVDNTTRNNKVKGRNQYVNNMVYNWKNAAYIMGGESTSDAYCNATDNLFIKGPAGGGTPFSGGNSNFHLYASGNWYDGNVDKTLNPSLIPNSDYSGGPDFQAAPYAYPALTTLPATKLIDSLIPAIGASLPYRDIADWYMINEVLSFGTEGKLISDETQLPFGAPTNWTVWAGTSRIDTDHDGMPDTWESVNGTNPALDDAMTIASNGYANIENYINSLTSNNRQAFLRTPVSFALDTSAPTSLTLSWLDYTENEDGFIIEQLKDNSYTEVARTAKGIQNVVLDNLEPATAYTLRIKAFNSILFSDYSPALTVKTQPVQVPVIDPAAYVPDLTWSADNGTWDYTSTNWNNGTTKFDSLKAVLFEPLSSINVTLNDTVPVSSFVMRDDGDVTISGTGCISGSGSLNKTGAGKLALGATNNYTGASVLWDGTVEFSSLKDGGIASSLGASQEFAQNWIWKGGAWKYTGASTSTNRSATLYNESEFNIANSGTTVTMNGSFEGSGGLILNGAGQLTINKPFAYTGNTTLKGGTLYMEGATMIDQGLGTSPKLVLAGGSFKTKDQNDRYGVYSFPIEVVKDTHSTFYVNRNCSIKSQVSGAGMLEYQVNYLREYVTGDWSNFTGTLLANGVNTSTGNCQLMLFNGIGIPNAVVQTKGNLQIVCWSTNAVYQLGGLSGPVGTYLCGTSKSTTAATMKWIVGGANTDETFNGVIDNRCSASGYNGTTSIVKTGEGLWRLTGSNVYKGTTDVEEGTLIVNGAHTGAGAITVKDGATLAGFGSLAGKVTVLDGGWIKAGDTLVNNLSLSLKGGLVLNAASATEIPLLKSSPTLRKANKLAVTGAAVLNGVLKLNLDAVTYSLSADNYFDLFDFSAATVTGAFTAVEPEIPAEGLKWDLSKLYTQGRIYVRDKDYVALSPAPISDVQVCPTVVSDKLTVTFPASAKQLTASLFNAAGKELITVKLDRSGFIDVSSFPDGSYLLKLTDQANHMTVKQFIKK